VSPGGGGAPFGESSVSFMSTILDALRGPWPWYVAGPLIGLTVPLLLSVGRRFGLSSNLRHMCAVVPAARRTSFFAYDWRREGGWNLLVFAGIAIGGFVGGVLLANPEPLAVAEPTSRALAAQGLAVDGALAPAVLFSWSSLFTLPGFVVMVLGGFLIGFGARWAGGCTSGHAIMGLSEVQWPSLLAVVGFFVGGLLATHLVLPLVLGL
jgi:uncharacterized protein